MNYQTTKDIIAIWFFIGIIMACYYIFFDNSPITPNNYDPPAEWCSGPYCN